MDRCSVFCTVDIPTNTLDRLLQCCEEYLVQFRGPNETSEVSDYISIIDSNDIATITKGSSPPVPSCPNVFFDNTLQQVRDWFDANITQPRPKGFMPHCFLVLDDKTANDDSCIFVCTQDSAPGEIQSVRCTFDIALQSAVDCYFGQSITEGSMGRFMRSGVTMTKANLKLVSDGGLYIERGDVKVDEGWRDFRNQW